MFILFFSQEDDEPTQTHPQNPLSDHRKHPQKIPKTLSRSLFNFFQTREPRTNPEKKYQKLYQDQDYLFWCFAFTFFKQENFERTP